MDVTDPVFLTLLMGAFVILVGGALAIGRLLDPKFRLRQKRRFLRVNEILLNHVNKDTKTILPRIVNADEDVFLHHNSIWLVEKGKIYRLLNVVRGLGNVLKDCPKIIHDGKEGYFIPIDKSQGFNIKEETPAESGNGDEKQGEIIKKRGRT